MRIITLNIWGAPYARDHSARLKAITDRIHLLQPDFVCLQEVYLQNQRTHLWQHLSQDLPHSHYFPSGMLGSGLMTFSRHPIIDTSFHAFRLRGKPEKAHHGDYYAAKGIGRIRIQSPHGTLDIYNIHTHAQYQPENDNEYAIFTNTNLYEAARFIRSQSSNQPWLLCGDFNTRPDQLGYTLIRQLTGADDLYLNHHQNHPITFASANPYTTSQDQCLDYIMASAITVSTITLEFTTHPQSVPAYSDHYGLIADFQHPAQVSFAYPPLNQPSLHHLHKDLNIALSLLENARFMRFGYLISTLMAIPDTLSITRILARIHPLPAKIARRLALLLIVTMVITNLLQIAVNLQNRRNHLLALLAEIEVHLHPTS
jgi:sphingomyelin phosphodiesterase 2